MNDVINLDFVFQFAGDVPPTPVNSASNIVQTGDALQIALLIILALVAFFSGVFLYLKRPVTVVGKHCALTKTKIAPRGGQNAVLKFALITSAVLLCLFSVIFATTNAFAKNESNSVVQTPEQVFVSVDRDSGFISIDDSWMKNVGAKDLLFETSTLSINSEVIDVATLASVNMKISALGGILYSGNPDGQPYVIDSLTHVFKANTQETLSFVLSNLNGETAKQLVGKKVFSLQLNYDEAVNPIHDIVVPDAIETTYDKNPHGASVTYEVDGDLPTELFYRKQGIETWIEGFPQVVNVVDSGIYEYKITATDKFLVYETIGEYNPITINKATRSIIEWSIENQPTFPDSLYTTFKLSDDEYDDTIITVRPASSGEYFPFTYNVDKSKKEITFIPSDGTGKFGVDATLNIISSNYNDASYNQTLVVGLRQLSFNVNNVSAVYDNNEHWVSFTSDSSTPNNISVDYSLSGESTSYHKEWTDVSQALQLDDIKQKDAITDEIKIEFTASVKGYTDLKGVASIKISPIQVSLDWSEATTSFIYNATIQYSKAKIVVPSGVVTNDLSLIYDVFKFEDNNESNVESKSVGNYVSKVSGIQESGQPTNNYSLPEDLSRYQLFNITPLTVQIKWTESSPAQWVYQGPTVLRWCHASVDNIPEASDDEVSIELSLAKDGEVITYGDVYKAGSYTWTASGLSGEVSVIKNYKLPTLQSEICKTKSISPAVLDSFSWGETEFTYDGNDQHPVATISSGIIGSDIVNVTNYEIKIKDGAIVSSSIDADEYQIKPIALDNSNYQISASLKYKDFTIKQADSYFTILNIDPSDPIALKPQETKSFFIDYVTDEEISTDVAQSDLVDQISIVSNTLTIKTAQDGSTGDTTLTVYTLGSKNYKEINVVYHLSVEEDGIYIKGTVGFDDPSFDGGHIETMQKGLKVKFEYQESDTAKVKEGSTISNGDYSINVSDVPLNTSGYLIFEKNGYYGQYGPITIVDYSLLGKDFNASGPDFENYTWGEVKNISTDISQKGENSVYYKEAAHYAEKGVTKTLYLGPDHSETDTGSDRLFMRIIGINHDDKADGGGTAGLTFMAANAINTGYYYEDNGVSNTKNWNLSELRNNMNSGEIYNLLIGALGGVTPEKVNKSYANGYKDGTGTYDPNLSSNPSEDTFFLPSLYEIGGDSYKQSGEEGKQYQYIKNDRWLVDNTPRCEWHTNYPGSVLNSINWKGYLWFLGRGPLGSGGPEWVINHTANDAYFACKDVGGCVVCNYPNNSWERSVYPYSSDYAMCLNCNGDPGNFWDVYDTCCVAPCFCL